MTDKTRAIPLLLGTLPFTALAAESGFFEDSSATLQPVSYTHLTLPTILLV